MTTLLEPQNDFIASIYDEMARQMGDSRDSILQANETAAEIAATIRQNGRLILLGMGGSHAVGRAVAPCYRALGIQAVALPLSEQLDCPVPLEGWTAMVTSQSGESAEVLRWFAEERAPRDSFGLTMEPTSSLANLVPCLIGAGGSEIPFAATRSLTVTLALHAAVLQHLGADLSSVFTAMQQSTIPDLTQAVGHFKNVKAIVTSGRHQQGVAEAIALGLTELSRLPCFSLESGQLRHGPVEMLNSEMGVVMFRADDPSSTYVTSLAEFTLRESDAPLILFDASDLPAVEGALTVQCPKSEGLAASFALLSAAQRFMVDFSASRVTDVGTPLRCSKVTKVE